MKKSKIVFEHTLLISTGILMVMSMECLLYHFLGDDIVLEWYQPIAILLTALLCSIPSVIWIGIEDRSGKAFWIQLVLHCLLLYMVIVGLGYVFGWYGSPMGFVLMSISYFLVYAFVWAGSYLLRKQDDKAINKALDDIRDEE